MQNKISRSSLNDTAANHKPLNIYKIKAYLLWELKQGLTEILNHGQQRYDNNNNCFKFEQTSEAMYHEENRPRQVINKQATLTVSRNTTVLSNYLHFRKVFEACRADRVEIMQDQRQIPTGYISDQTRKINDLNEDKNCEQRKEKEIDFPALKVSKEVNIGINRSTKREHETKNEIQITYSRLICLLYFLFQEQKILIKH